jgi:hypothetical protein
MWKQSFFVLAPKSTPYFSVSLNDLRVTVEYTVFCVYFSAAHVNFLHVMLTLLLSTQFLELVGLMHFSIHIFTIRMYGNKTKTFRTKKTSPSVAG